MCAKFQPTDFNSRGQPVFWKEGSRSVLLRDPWRPCSCFGHHHSVYSSRLSSRKLSVYSPPRITDCKPPTRDFDRGTYEDTGAGPVNLRPESVRESSISSPPLHSPSTPPLNTPIFPSYPAKYHLPKHLNSLHRPLNFPVLSPITCKRPRSLGQPHPRTFIPSTFRTLSVYLNVCSCGDPLAGYHYD